jgi:hypothetical protein
LNASARVAGSGQSRCVSQQAKRVIPVQTSTSRVILRDGAKRTRDRQDDARVGGMGDTEGVEIAIGDSSVRWPLLTRMTVTAGQSPVLMVRSDGLP